MALRGLRRSFGARDVLRGLDLDLRPGEFVALLGRSGSGKTTLLRALAGLDRGAEGEGWVPERRSVVFQDARLLPWATVLDNVVLGLGGRDPLAAGRRALAEVGLDGHEDDWPKTLSGGEAQRAALARALVREPELLLLDEPFGALDALTRVRMHALVQQLHARHRPAVLLVTHDVDEAVLLADRVLVLTDGVIALDEPVDVPSPRLRRDPAFLALRSPAAGRARRRRGVRGRPAASPTCRRPACRPAHRPSRPQPHRRYPMTLTDAAVDLDVVHLSGSIGAEIRGLDLRDLDGPTVDAIRRVWLERKVVFFPGQQLEPDEHLAFARLFGEPTEGHPVVPGLAEHPEVFEIDYTAARELYASYGDVSTKYRGIAWHTDVTFVKRPPLGSILRAVVVPAGGRRHPLLRPAGGVRGPEPGAAGVPVGR